MPLFKHLVERIVLEKDDLDLKVFEHRIIENQRNNGAVKSSRDREATYIRDRSEKLVDCYPFHDIAMQAREDLASS